MPKFTLIPEFTYDLDEEYKTDKTPFASGHTQRRSRWPYPKRRWGLRWTNAIKSEKEYVQGFFHGRRGPGNNFDYDPSDPIQPPQDEAQASTVTSGALASRTYTYGLTWITAQGETTLDYTYELAIPANDVLFIKVPLSLFPKNATGAGVYVGEDEDPLTLQATVTKAANTWQEPDTGLVSGNAPPSSNTAFETVVVFLEEDRIRYSKHTAAVYTIDLVFVEA